MIVFCLVGLGALINAKPSKIEYSRELEFLSRALDADHPKPWRNRSQQAFRENLTRDPDILDGYPFAPWLSISTALLTLDEDQRDSVTGINLLHQNRSWLLLPITFAMFEDGFYIVAAEEPYGSLIGRELLTVNGASMNSLYSVLKEYFPERDVDWLPQFLRISELLEFMDAGCKSVCQLKISGSMGIQTVDIKISELLQSMEYQRAMKPVYISQLYRQNLNQQDPVRMIDQHSLFWQLSGNMLKSTLTYNEYAALAERYLNNRLLDNVVLDIRDINRIDPLLVERLIRLVRQIHTEDPQRTIYAMIDRSTHPVVFELLGRLSEIPAVQFVGESVALKLSYYYDAKQIALSKTGLEITIATRFSNYLTTYPDQQEIRPEQVLWSSTDYFNGEDSVFGAILALIEINRP